MTGSIVRQLILKDLYLFRWMIAGAIAIGVAAVALLPVSTVASYVGAVILICVIIVLNIFLVMGGVVQERKDKVQLFLLSLPLSPFQYTLTKVAGNAIAFVLPWVVLTIAAVVTIHFSRIPNGILPYWIALLVYLLMYYCVLLAIGLLFDSTGAHATAITLGNISVNFVIPFLLSLPSVVRNKDAAHAVWTPDILSIVAIELAFGVAVLGGALYLRSRTTDFV